MNLATFLMATLVAAVFIAIVVVAVRNKKQGKGSCACSGNCASCGRNGGCH